MPDPLPVLALVVCAAPPAARIHDLARELRRRGWDVYAVATPAAAEWIDTARLEEATGNAVRFHTRRPDEPRSQPYPDVVVVAPATFNTVNQWAAGINDSAALGVLNEALGARTPIVAAPHVMANLAAHPAFARNLEFLRSAGVRLTDTAAISPATPDGPFQWQPILDLLP
jgi:phosphopantothenoylcysteine synthetase/decarboxylase